MAESTTFSAADMKLLVAFIKHSEIGKTDWEAVYQETGHKNANSARECWRGVKQKKLKMDGKAPATPSKRKDTGEGGDPATPTSKPKRARKSKKAQEAEDEEEGMTNIKGEEDDAA